jgi:putative ABC transport system ATP-binding protein
MAWRFPWNSTGSCGNADERTVGRCEQQHAHRPPGAQRLQERLGKRKSCAIPHSRSVTSSLGTGLALRASMAAPALRVPAQQSDSAPLVLACEALSKVYRMGEVDVRALDGVDFALHEAELVVLVGASGSGKSTLLNILGGLDVPTSGRVCFGALELSGAVEEELTRYRRHSVGFVFQFYNLIPSLTARENVALVTDIADDPLEPEEALALVGLGDRLDHFPAQLSGGEQQRVAIARAVAKRPKVLLCDEPTGALDSKTGILVLEVIERVNREVGTATAIITHNAPIAEIADRVVTLADGRVQSQRYVGRRARASELSW